MTSVQISRNAAVSKGVREDGEYWRDIDYDEEDGIGNDGRGDHYDYDADTPFTKEYAEDQIIGDLTEAKKEAMNNLWKFYEIDPEQTLEPGKLYSVKSLFSKSDYKKLGAPERRVHVGPYKFKITTNQKFTGSLYRSISHAVYARESEFSQVHRNILSQIRQGWVGYCDIIRRECSANLDIPNANTQAELDNNYILYKDYSLSMTNSAVALELHSAAVLYDFNFTLFDVHLADREVYSFNCDEKKGYLSRSKVHYYFLRSADSASPESWYYEYLIPIGPIESISEGRYPVKFRHTIVVNEEQIVITTEQGKSRPNLPYKTLIKWSIALHYREFMLRATHTEDLWSLLSELMFKRLKFTKLLRDRVRQERKVAEFTARIAGKRAKKNSRPEYTLEDFKFLKDTSGFLEFGDLNELQTAADIFGFSYVLIGADGNLNFFWKEFQSPVQEQISARYGSIPFFALYVRLGRRGTSLDTYWCALDEISKGNADYERIYGGVTKDNMRLWNNKMYFRPHARCAAQTSKTKGRIKWFRSKKPRYLVPSRGVKGSKKKLKKERHLLQAKIDDYITETDTKEQSHKLSLSGSHSLIKIEDDQLSSWIPFWNFQRQLPSFSLSSFTSWLHRSVIVMRTALRRIQSSVSHLRRRATVHPLQTQSPTIKEEVYQYVP